MHLYGYARSAAIVYSGNPNLFSAFGFLAGESGVRSEPGLKQPAKWGTRVVAKCTGQKTNLKGRLNFSTLGTGPGHIITLSDSNFQKTIATANNRPSNDANDAYVGYDQGDGNPANIAINLGEPKSVSKYIANACDGPN